MPDKNAAANRVVSNGKIFASLGYETVFLGLSDSDEQFDGTRQINGKSEMLEQARPASVKEWVYRIFATKEICFLAEKHNAGMVILYNLPFFTLWRVKKALSKKNIEVAYDCTEWTKDTEGSVIKRAFKVFDEFLVSNFAHKVADRMIVISSKMRKKYSSCQKLLLLPPLVDANDPIWHQKPQKNPDLFEFCFAGVPDGKKESLDKVVEAFLSLKNKNARLKIVGVTKEEYISRYGELPSDLSDGISFMGRVSHEEAVKSILGCDCYIFIRRSDKRNNAGFPTKFAEAFTCAVPVITTDVSDVGAYIKESGRGEVLADMTTEKIAFAMQSAVKKGKSMFDGPDIRFHYETYLKDTEKWFE